jgi:hypothetical protein
VHAALQLAPVLAEGKSKLPFYIAGGLLVGWALIVSIGIGMRKPTFPQSLGQQRAIMAITGRIATLLLAADRDHRHTCPAVIPCRSCPHQALPGGRPGRSARV